ncbi:hypothetical protein [Anabaena sp. CCY 9910]|uniref:hypothetical protein n=1 Tax=Anabaena sp. CCY 9910 TaxID=3103870 RepID=UPI0039DFF08F
MLKASLNHGSASLSFNFRQSFPLSHSWDCLKVRKLSSSPKSDKNQSNSLAPWRSLPYTSDTLNLVYNRKLQLAKLLYVMVLRF